MFHVEYRWGKKLGLKEKTSIVFEKSKIRLLIFIYLHSHYSGGAMILGSVQVLFIFPDWI